MPAAFSVGVALIEARGAGAAGAEREVGRLALGQLSLRTRQRRAYQGTMHGPIVLLGTRVLIALVGGIRLRHLGVALSQQWLGRRLGLGVAVDIDLGKRRERFVGASLHAVSRKVASLRDATSQRWLVGPLWRADLAAFLRVSRNAFEAFLRFGLGFT